MSPKIINLLFMAAVIATPIFGCASALFDYRWYRAAPPLEPVWVQVSVEQARAICDDPVRGHIGFACVKRRLELGICLVFSPAPREDVPDWIVHHEAQKHCREGLDHD